MLRFDRRLGLVLLSGSVGLVMFSCNGTDSGTQSLTQTQTCQVNQAASQPADIEKHPPNSVCMRDSVSMLNFYGAIGMSDFNIVAGDIVALNDSSVDMGVGVYLDGSIFLNDDAHFHPYGGDFITGVVRHSDESKIAKMTSDFIDSLEAMAPTQSFDNIYRTTVIRSSGKVNVIEINNIALYETQKLILVGAPHDVFILNVSGDISTGGGGAGIFTSRDLSPRNVIINNIGPGRPVWIGGYDALTGTLIAGHRSIEMAGANVVFGALVAGKGISLFGPHGFWSPAGFCGGSGSPNPDPSPSPTPTASPTDSPTPVPSCIPAPSPSATPTPTPSVSQTSSPAPTPSDTSSPVPTPSPSSSGVDCSDVVCAGGPIGI